MIRLCLLATFANFFLVMHSQSIPDSELKWFKWTKLVECISDGEYFVTLQKAQEDPRILQLNENEFKMFLSDVVKQLSFEKYISDTLKLKLLFPINEPLCLIGVGSKNMELDNKQLEILDNHFRSIKEISNGKQLGGTRNCEGILYLKIKEGELVEFRNVNFGFAVK